MSTTWGSTGYDFGGDDDRIGVIDVGNTKSVTFWINPDTTTEEIMKFTASSGVKINVSSGTIGTTGWTSPTVYVNGLVSSTLVADKWQFVAITSATAFDASQTTLGWSDAGYGDLSLAEVRMYNCTLTDEEIQYLHEMNLPSN